MKLAAALISVLLAAAGSRAATTVLYETGWEAAPASPAWTIGPVVPQNGWLGQNSSAGHQVVANGSQGTVMAPSGTRFHKFTASADPANVFDRLAWVDITDAASAARSAGQNVVKSSLDVYVPGSQAAIPGLYGLAAFHGSDLPWGVLIDPSDRSVNIVVDGNIPKFTRAAFAFDTWFNLVVTGNYDTGSISVSVDGIELPELTTPSANILVGALTDVDLFAENSDPSASSPRITFSDNFQITASGAAPRPVLTIAPGAVGEWHLSWSANFRDWILESTQDIGATDWTNEGVSPNVDEMTGVASVDLADAPPHFYRLRKP